MRWSLLLNDYVNGVRDALRGLLQLHQLDVQPSVAGMRLYVHVMKRSCGRY